jgi:hypothetical protein
VAALAGRNGLLPIQQKDLEITIRHLPHGAIEEGCNLGADRLPSGKKGIEVPVKVPAIVHVRIIL